MSPWRYSYIRIIEKWFPFQPPLSRRVSVFQSVANLESGLGTVGSVQFVLDNKIFYPHISITSRGPLRPIMASLNILTQEELLVRYAML